MNITVIGCGRWGSFIAMYLNNIGHNVTLYGRPTSKNMQGFIKSRKNDYLTMPASVSLQTELKSALSGAKAVVVSVDAQGFRSLCREIREAGVENRIFILCMKGIEISTGMRLSQVAEAELSPSNKIAVWLGPGHVQDFCRGVPNCMVMDSADEALKIRLADSFSSNLIRFYYGNDLIGNEIGAAAKNVIGIAAGFLDGLDISSLKGSLMSRGTLEISRLIKAMGGAEKSAYGLCHLGDYEATVFSKFSQNRRFGEAFLRGERFDKLAEGYYTVKAIQNLCVNNGVDTPICSSIYRILYEKADFKKELDTLFSRSTKREFY